MYEVQYVLHLDDCSHPLYVHSNVGIQVSDKSCLELNPMCQIAQLVKTLIHLNNGEQK